MVIQLIATVAIGGTTLLIFHGHPEYVEKQLEGWPAGAGWARIGCVWSIASRIIAVLIVTVIVWCSAILVGVAWS